MNEKILFKAEKAAYSRPYEHLNTSQRVFYVVWELEAQVNNGGFWQYFYNSSGALAPNAPNALRTIGAHQCADIVTRAISLIAIDTEVWLDDMQRKAFINDLTTNTKQLLELIDTDFYRYPDDLSGLLSSFVNANSRDFDL